MSKNGKASMTPRAKGAMEQFKSKAFKKALELNFDSWGYKPGRVSDLCHEAWAAGYFYAKQECIHEARKSKSIVKQLFLRPKSERPKDHSIILFYADGNECIGTYQSVNDTIYTDEAPDGGFYRWETDNIGEKWCYWDDVFEITNEGELKE